MDWAGLPYDVLTLLGGLLSQPAHVSSASRVCSAWHRGITAGVSCLDLDLHPSKPEWDAKVQQLGALTPRVSSVALHCAASRSPSSGLASSISALAGSLAKMERLHLELADGYELELSNADELQQLSGLRSLTLSGGLFAAPAINHLLACLARACPVLEELHILPEARCGLGDEQVALLCRMQGLKVLEFRAYALTAAGLTSLAARLPELVTLRCHGLDTCLDAATAACFASRPSLRELHLGCEQELSAPAMQQLRDVHGDISMTFRWTDRLNGLLKMARLHLQARLVRLDLGTVRLGQDPATSLIEPLAALTALSELRMRVYSNQDAAVTLNLSQLTALSSLEVLHVTKKVHPLADSSIAVPLSAASAAALAAGCQRLSSLRLVLGRSDVTPEGLAELRRFSGLRSLSVSAEAFGQPQQPVALDLLALPRSLTSLELRCVDVSTPPAALLAAGDGGPAGCLGQLGCLRLEGCRLHEAQLQALSHALPRVQQLALDRVAGLTDACVSSLSRLTSLRELTVASPLNRSLTQASLVSLAPLRGLRQLTWESDDLRALGPVVAAFSAFTALRLLSLSCTPATLERAVVAQAQACTPAGATPGRYAFGALLPYATLDLRAA